MSEPSAFGFGQFVPGFDFLQNLSKNAAQAEPAAAAGMPGMASWVAPTLSIEDIDKRIQELKSVLFWLEQNTTALKATIQAMEVQKMTLTTLQSMNVNMADLAKAFTVKPPVAEPAPPAAAQASEHAAPKSSWFTLKAAPQAAVEPETSLAPEPASAAPAPTDAPAAASTSEAAKPAVDPMQWWGALTQQFQGIAAAAMKDVAGEAMKAGMSARSARSAKTTKPVKAAKPVKTPAGRKTSVASKTASRPAQASAPRRAKAPAKSAAAPSAKAARAAPKSAASARQSPPK